VVTHRRTARSDRGRTDGGDSTPDTHPFALCLTHDVDRVYKTYQAPYYAVTERDPGHLLDLLPGRDPYWQFDTIMDLEADLGVRSAFYFLNEQHLFRDRPVRSWVSPEGWRLYLGRYSLDDPAIVETIRDLDAGGWEVGIHGSYESYDRADRFQDELDVLERVLGHEVLGGRQHYLNLDRPRTWEIQAEAGLRYDATLGSTESYGFHHGYDPLRPFDDEFVVFPLTLMELTLSDVEDDPDTAWAECERLLEEARDNGAVMTVLWHPSYFSDRDFPNFGTLYRRLVERAQEMGAWVGPPGDLYDMLDHPAPSRRSGSLTREIRTNGGSDSGRDDSQGAQ